MSLSNVSHQCIGHCIAISLKIDFLREIRRRIWETHLKWVQKYRKRRRTWRPSDLTTVSIKDLILLFIRLLFSYWSPVRSHSHITCSETLTIAAIEEFDRQSMAVNGSDWKINRWLITRSDHICWSMTVNTEFISDTSLKSVTKRRTYKTLEIMITPVITYYDKSFKLAIDLCDIDPIGDSENCPFQSSMWIQLLARIIIWSLFFNFMDARKGKHIL